MRIGSKDRRSGRGDGRRDAPDASPGRPSTPAGEVRLEGYVDLQVIGHGASSTVYRATQEGYDRQVAVKVLNIDISDRRAQRRFQRERSLNGRLSGHPNVVTVLDSGFVDGRYPYLAMELFELGSLADHLRLKGVFDVPSTLHVGVRIAGALETAHRLGVLHRDVKPQNVLQSRFGEPALADFGIAAILQMEQSLTVALTPVHAAPELLEGADPSERTDVYALASTLFTMLAGTPPFAGPAGEGMLAQLLRITTSDLPSLGRPDVPWSLTAVLRHAMAKRPDERLAGAADLGLALQAVQAELGVPVTPLPVEIEGEHAPVVPAATTPSTDDHVEPAPFPPAPPVTAGDSLPPPTTLPLAGRPAAPPKGVPVSRPAPVVAGPVRPMLQPAGAVLVGARVDDPTVDVPGEDHTVTARHIAAPRPVVPRRRRWVVPTACAGALVVGTVGAGLVTMALRRDGATPTSSSRVTAVTTGTAATTVATTLPADVSAQAPTDLRVSNDAGSVLLTWVDHTSPPAQVVVYTYRADRAPEPLTVQLGRSSQLVAGVTPSDPVCFVVTAVVAVGPPVRTANSPPTCINGAVVSAATATTAP